MNFHAEGRRQCRIRNNISKAFILEANAYSMSVAKMGRGTLTRSMQPRATTAAHRGCAARSSGVVIEDKNANPTAMLAVS